MPVYGLDFYANQLEILRSIIAAAPPGVLVIQTVYSPFMQACTTTGRDLLRAHIEEDPGAVCAGMERITESMLAYVKECVRLGVDGFYASSQGGDRSMFDGSPRFDQCVKPFDLALMQEMDRRCRFNILHICDFHGSYEDLGAFTDYPGHVVSVPGSVEAEGAQWARNADRFQRPLMGGLDRHGIIATGSEEAIVSAVERVLAVAPGRFVLGADCTLPATVSWDRIRIAIAAAHAAGAAPA
jgi:uroporphyrinogen decarboxylase